MKQKLKNILVNPKVIIPTAIIIAFVVALMSSVYHRKSVTEMFANINGMKVASTTEGMGASPQDLTLAFPTGGRIKGVYVKIGDTVTAGTVLASLDAENTIGAINQAKASYLVAQTNYDKLVNGASTPDVAVTQASVDAATTALDNARQNLVRDLATGYSSVNSVILSGTNNLFSNPNSASPQFGLVGTVQTNQQLVSIINNERVQINANLAQWQTEIAALDQSNVDLVVVNSASYLSNTNSYLSDILNALATYSQSTSSNGQVALTASQSSVTGAKATVNSIYVTITNDMQAIKNAKPTLAQAKASLALKQAPARSEDLRIAQAQVQSTQGALQIAQSAYNNTVITAPVHGKIINVSITAGQIATPNTPAIEMLSQ